MKPLLDQQYTETEDNRKKTGGITARSSRQIQRNMDKPYGQNDMQSIMKHCNETRSLWGPTKTMGKKE